MKLGRAAWAVDNYSSKGWLGYGVALAALAVVLALVLRGPFDVIVPILFAGGSVTSFVQAYRASVNERSR